MKVIGVGNSAREKGASLEDAVASFFRHFGFRVETRVKMRDKSGVLHEIDVLAYKVEPFGTIRVAVECKNINSPVDIREIRNFHSKLLALNINKGIFISTCGFSAEATAYAKSLNIELWDSEVFKRKLYEVKLAEQDTKREKIIYDVLPVNEEFYQHVLPEHIMNREVLSVSNTKLEYLPLYLIKYYCFSQRKVAGNDVVIESKGYLIINATDGSITSCKCLSGNKPNIPELEAYNECLFITPRTIDLNQIIESTKFRVVNVISPEINEAQAEEQGKVWLVKTLTIDYKYSVRFPSKTVWRHRTIQPAKSDIRIDEIRLIRVPIISATLAFRGKEYVRRIQAATIKVLIDETKVCKFKHGSCTNSSIAVCENCGTIICNQHMKVCMRCNRPVCNDCAVGIGFLSKKYYCPEHKPD
jgi:predicted RecB family endonuclease